ncbi:MAG: molybdopterin molybdotransferase MoeA [Planctomycetes bacterium]|nr:molybdopterin molybdotransferase MoeA [Planctomycetota bacterium]
MRGFRERVSVARALEVALDGLSPRHAEDVPLERAAGRVLARDVVSQVDVPSFDRSAMDGYAVDASATFGATPYDPVKLGLNGESMPGCDVSRVEAGPLRAVRIMTGAPMPRLADAVVPAEQARESGNDVFIDTPVTPWKNVGRRGEDVRAGIAVMNAGRRLRPQDLGLLASIGFGVAPVVASPRVRILVSGNELVAPGERPQGSQIVDSNTPMLRALVECDGGTVEAALRLRDDADAIRDAITAPGADVIVAAGGTSVGREDHLPNLVREVGRLDVHGVAMRPSSPTGIGTVGRTRIFLLPGNPVSCLAAYDFFAGPAIRRLAGMPVAWPYPSRRVRLAGPLSSQIGRTDYCRVTVGPGGASPLAVAGASVLSSTTRAAGFVVVPAGSEGYAAGTEVEVFFYDPLAERDA